MGHSELKRTQFIFEQRYALWRTALDLQVFSIKDLRNKYAYSWDYISLHILEMLEAGAIHLIYLPDTLSINRSTQSVYMTSFSNTVIQEVPKWYINTWKTMRIFRRFTIENILDALPAASVDASIVQQMCDDLCELDILRIDGHNQSIAPIEKGNIYVLARVLPHYAHYNNSNQSGLSTSAFSQSQRSATAITLRTAATILLLIDELNRDLKWESHFLKEVKSVLPEQPCNMLKMELVYNHVDPLIEYVINDLFIIYQAGRSITFSGDKQILSTILEYTSSNYKDAYSYYFSMHNQLLTNERYRILYPRSHFTRLLICLQSLKCAEGLRDVTISRQRKRLEQALLGRELVLSEEKFMELAYGL